jgi:hypothetical protein
VTLLDIEEFAHQLEMQPVTSDDLLENLDGIGPER